MPLWLLCSLLSPFFWAIVFVLDSHCVEEIFEESWFGGVTSAISMTLLFPFMLGGILVTEWHDVTMAGVQLALLGGALHMLSQFCYFRALGDCESGIVSAYWNMTPLIILIIGFLLLNEKLSLLQYGGVGGLIACSVLFCILDNSATTRWSTFLLMLAASGCEASYFILIKQAFSITPGYFTLLSSTIAMIAVGLSPLCFTKPRQILKKNRLRLLKAMPILIGIEIANLIAVGLSQYAINYGNPSLVAAVEATLPAYCFLLSGALWGVFRKFGEETAKYRLPQKLALSVAMGACVWILA